MNFTSQTVVTAELLGVFTASELNFGDESSIFLLIVVLTDSVHGGDQTQASSLFVLFSVSDSSV